MKARQEAADGFYRHLREWFTAFLPRQRGAAGNTITSCRPLARFDGTLTVAGRSIDVSGWPGMVGHNWGSQHAERWIWLHAMSFDAAEETTWLDVVLARIKFVGRTTPWIAPAESAWTASA